MAAPFLHTTSGKYDRAAIMRRSWARARNTVARHGTVGIPTTLRAAFADALRQTWDKARSARSLAAWAEEQDRAAEATKALDARTREIMGLQAARIAADGIDSTRSYLATIHAINARLAAIHAA